jgi:predicted ATPase
MEQKIENFGPIKQMDIKLKPLTVIIGRNCSGKSYFASLLYAYSTLGRREREEGVPELFMLMSPKDFERLLKNVRSDASEKEIVEKIVEAELEIYKGYLEKSLKTQLENIFGVEINDLIRLGASDATIKFLPSPDSLIEVTLKKPNKVLLNFHIDKGKVSEEILSAIQKRGRGIFSRELRAWRRGKRRSVTLPPFFMVAYLISQELFTRLSAKEELNTVYIIPAGRAGLLEGYNTVQSALLTLSPIAPIKGVSMPPIPGPAAEFYKILLQLRGRKGPLYRLTEDFENIMDGKVTIKSVGKLKGKTTITYSFRSNGETREIDIIHSASGIKELALLCIIVRELVKKGDLLIIEEPEAHLHPEAQIKLMKVISTIVRSGVKVLMTTHSDLLIRKLAQQTGIYSRSKGKDPSGLNPEDFGLYLFKESKNGSVSKRIPLSKYGSIEEIPTFDEVMRELYKEGVSLQSSLQMKE